VIKEIDTVDLGILASRLVDDICNGESYVRGFPSREASARALLARSLIKHYLRTLQGDRMELDRESGSSRQSKRSHMGAHRATSNAIPHVTF
jgi:hypothetical protein